MIHGRTRSIKVFFASFLAASFFIEGTQAVLEARAKLAARQGTSTSSTPSTSSASSTSSTSPTATTRSFFFFENPPQTTTCGSSTISWIYSGLDNPLTLQVTNVDVSQDEPAPSSTSTRYNTASDIIGTMVPSTLTGSSDLTVTIATNLTPTSVLFTWNPVNVPQGWYIMLATIPAVSLTQSSSPFFVRTGTNTSCLAAIGSNTTSTTTPSSTSTTTSSAVTSIPVSTNRVGIIVGVVVGVVALAIVLITGWLCLHRKIKSHTSGSGRSNKPFAHQWNGLSSTDSRKGFAASEQHYQSSRSHVRSDPDSIGTGIEPDFEDGIGTEKSTTHLNSNGKASNFFEAQGVALSTLPVLHHRPRPTRTHSASSSTSNVISTNDLGVSSVKRSVQGPTPRRPSIDSSSVYPPSSPISPHPLRESVQYGVAPDLPNSHNPSTTGTQRSSHQFCSTPISPPASLSSPPLPFSTVSSQETKQMNRQSLGRKRKPVPVYDFDQEEPASPSLPVFAPSLPFPTKRDSVTVPELAHKSSFGPGGIEGKPLHYLIPDMPMPVNR